MLNLIAALIGFADPTCVAAHDLIARIVPDRASDFVCERVAPANGKDVFELETRDGKVVVRGSDGVAMASAFNRYLEQYCHCQVSWGGDQLKMPKRLPSVPKPLRVVSPYTYRYDFNYCTFNYSMSWWDWKRWEREIDWMAMHGINMPLALTGQEAVWQSVYRAMGFTDDELKGFFCGPAYFAWFWMGNLDAWGGPLPQSWFDSHKALQQQILGRERALGMKPVLPAFSGHVPASFKQHFPEAKVRSINWGLDFGDTVVLDPGDPLFNKIGTTFLREQTKLYGTDHLYSSDTFNENRPPTNDTGFLKGIGSAVYRSMADVDPEATWVMQGWIFVNDPGFWKAPQAKALLSGVPDGRIIILDLWAEAAPIWSRTEAFYGAKWIWCMLHNFGGRQQLHGDLAGLAKEPSDALANPASGRMVGIGLSPEAIENNDVVYKLMCANAWSEKPIDLDAWLKNYVRNRYGAEDGRAWKAWQTLLKGVYGPNGRGGPDAGIVNARPTLASGNAWAGAHPHYPPRELVQAWEGLLSAHSKLGGSDPYRHDLVDVTRQVLANLAIPIQEQLSDAYHRGDLKAFKELSGLFLGLIGDLDRLMGTRREYLLGKWVADATRWGSDDAERRLYEMNAKRLLTLWGTRDGGLHEYSAREWNGLLGGFALKRWSIYLAALDDAMANGTKPDEDALGARIRQWEENWVEGQDAYPSEPQGDAVRACLDVRAKYAPLIERFGPKPVPMGLEKDAVVTASSVQSGHEARFAVDGDVDLDSAWWADPAPQWLMVDLKRPKMLGSIHFWPYWGDGRYYKYTIEASSDAVHWSTVVDKSENTDPSTSAGVEFQLKPVKVRYVRVNMLSNSSNPGVHIVELKLYPPK